MYHKKGFYRVRKIKSILELMSNLATERHNKEWIKSNYKHKGLIKC